MKTNKKGQWGHHIILFLIILLVLFPIVFAISNSFKSSQESFNNITSLIPRQPTLENYRYVADRLPILRIIGNTFLVAVIVTGVKLLTSLLSAYSLVFMDAKGKNVIYFIMLSTMFVPFTATMIPNYLIVSRLGLTDTLWGVMLPQFADVLGIFLLRQAMKNIPMALIEAVRLDGAKDRQVMRDLILPIIRPYIVSTGTMFFINSWNEFIWPVLILKTKDNYTLSLALQMFISSEGGTDFPIAMAVSVITMLIPLTLYLIFQRQIINTYVNSGIK